MANYYEENNNTVDVEAKVVDENNTASEQTTEQTTQQTTQQSTPVYAQTQTTQNPVKIMVFGIIAVALTCVDWAPYAGFIFGIVSIVFGALTQSWSSKYYAAGMPQDGRVKAGKITGLIGLILGIIGTVVSLIFTIVTCVAIAGAAAYGAY